VVDKIPTTKLEIICKTDIYQDIKEVLIF
jgi:hypothetical protein